MALPPPGFPGTILFFFLGIVCGWMICLFFSLFFATVFGGGQVNKTHYMGD